MAGGWTRDGGVQDQIDANIEDAVKRARNHLAINAGESSSSCEECGSEIPRERRNAIPGVRFCVECQSAFEKLHVTTGGINRSANKDSQLR